MLENRRGQPYNDEERGVEGAEDSPEPLTQTPPMEGDEMAASKHTLKAPAFQFYTKDFLADSNQMAMSLQEAGAYIRLMCHCWDVGSIPDDPVRLARLTGATTGQMRKLWPAIRHCFQEKPKDASRMLHPRLERERAKQAEYRRRQSDRAVKRWDDATAMPRHSHGTAVALQQPMPERCRNDALLSSSSSSTAVSPPTHTGAKVAHDGPRLKVWSWQHEDLGKRLGAKVDAFDLLGWYSRLEEELARTGESFADPWKWLQARLYRDADLSLPNLMGKERRPPKVATGEGWTCTHNPPCHDKLWCVSGARDERDKQKAQASA